MMGRPLQLSRIPLAVQRLVYFGIVWWLWLGSWHVVEAAVPWRSELYPENWQAPCAAVSFYTDKLLQDFSYAGYRRGEVALPSRGGVVFEATAYGADSTGRRDSTVAIQAAINAAAANGGGVVYLPAGEYRVSPQGANTYCLQIAASHIVLRGAGAGKTFLLNTAYQMRGKAVIQVAASAPSTESAVNITADLPGPTRRIPVANPRQFAAGDFVRIEWSFTEEWIAEHSQQNWWSAGNAPANARTYRQVLATDAGAGWIELDIPTRYAIKVRDNARVLKQNGVIAEVGVESLSIGNIQHPGSGWGENDYNDPGKAAYDTHASWLIRFSYVRDSWIRAVHSQQAEANSSTAHMLSNGISLLNCARITVQDCEMRRAQYGGGGGNGYMYRIQHSNDCLVVDSVAEFSRHGFVISHAGTSGNVFLRCHDRETKRATGSTGSYVTNGAGSDNHMHFSHSNLWDRCHAHNSFFTASHRGSWGTVPHALTSAHAVYWNTSGSGTRYPNIVQSEQARYGYVIGTSGSAAGATNPTGGNTAPNDHIEGLGMGAFLEPSSLYLDQLARRLQPPHEDPLAFKQWAGAEEITFAGDANGDGIADGLAWLLGADNPSLHAKALLPKLTPALGMRTLAFTILNQTNRDPAVVKIQHSTDLQSWMTTTVPDKSGSGNGVAFIIEADGVLNTVRATFPASPAAQGDTTFIRVIADGNP